VVEVVVEGCRLPAWMRLARDSAHSFRVGPSYFQSKSLTLCEKPSFILRIHDKIPAKRRE
jgi:hypothetical protein